MANYAKFVKEMHFPDVSERKRKEMETMVSLIKSSRQGTKKRSLNTIREHDWVSQSSGGSLTWARKYNLPNSTGQITNWDHAESVPNFEKKWVDWKKFKNEMVP